MAEGTSSSIEHMKDTHGLDEDGPVRKKARHGDGAMAQFVQNGGDPITAAQNEQALDFHHADFKALLCDWIITESVSFKQVESPKPQALLQYLQPR